jgi:hypothetical protein
MSMNSFGQTIFVFLLIFAMHSHALNTIANLKDVGVMSDYTESKIDPKVDYENFIGRATDKDKSGRVIKVRVENNNTKFLKSGDELYFEVNTVKSRRPCRAFVRSTEDFYFTMYVEDFTGCYKDRYFKRGTMLNFYAPIAAQRVLEASEYRDILIRRKESFLKQLNEINYYLWGFDTQRIQLAADYDERINQIKREKRIALDNFIEIKKEKLLLQKELQKRLDDLEASLNHYKVERQEKLTDRWDLDHESGIKFPQRPLKEKRIDRSQHSFNNYR